jgi:hypothetical protein
MTSDSNKTDDDYMNQVEKRGQCMYAIVPSEIIRNYLKSRRVSDNMYDLVWFVTTDREFAEKVKDYFEKCDGKSKMVEAMTMVTDPMYLKLKSFNNSPKFDIVEVYEDYWEYVESLEPPKPALRQEDRSAVLDFICVEGINNAFCFGGKEFTQINHNKNFVKKELTAVRKYFNNPNII